MTRRRRLPLWRNRSRGAGPTRISAGGNPVTIDAKRGSVAFAKLAHERDELRPIAHRLELSQSRRREPVLDLNTDALGRRSATTSTTATGELESRLLEGGLRIELGVDHADECLIDC